ALPARLRAASFAGALVSEVKVNNGAGRYAGDGPLLTTVAPGGARGRDRAIVGFRLARPATVRLDVVDKNAFVTDLRGVASPALTVSTQQHSLQPGLHELVWEPPLGQEPA